MDVCSVHHNDVFLRYSVSLLGYGFYADVLTDSETKRWLGPVRYDLSGMRALVFWTQVTLEAKPTYTRKPPFYLTLGWLTSHRLILMWGNIDFIPELAGPAPGPGFERFKDINLTQNLKLVDSVRLTFTESEASHWCCIELKWLGQYNYWTYKQKKKKWNVLNKAAFM